MKTKKEKWEYWGNHKNHKTNYNCYLCNSGKWRLEKTPTFGKWVFIVEPKEDSPKCPTDGDQKNFFSGLLEAEYRNDQYVFTNGETRPIQFKKKLEMFKGLLDDFIEVRGLNGIKYNLRYYFSKENGNKNI